MGGGESWEPIPAAGKDALTLEAVKIAAAAPGVDLNVTDSDGRFALDAARSLRYTNVVNFLTERGAKSKGR
jgi:hypothetical protein